MSPDNGVNALQGATSLDELARVVDLHKTRLASGEVGVIVQTGLSMLLKVKDAQYRAKLS